MNKEQLTVFRRRKVGFVFQNYNLVQDLNVYENIVLPIELDGRPVDKRFMEEMLDLLKLRKRKKHFRAICPVASSKELPLRERLLPNRGFSLLMNRPGTLDSASSHDVLGLLKVAAKQFRQTVILITHDMDIAQMADRIVHIEDGKIVKERGLHDEK